MRLGPTDITVSDRREPNRCPEAPQSIASWHHHRAPALALNAPPQLVAPPTPAADLSTGLRNVVAHGYWLDPLLVIAGVSIGLTTPTEPVEPLLRAVPRGLWDAILHIAVFWPPHLFVLMLGAAYHAAEANAHRPPVATGRELTSLQRGRLLTGIAGLLLGAATALSHTIYWLTDRAALAPH